MKVDNSINFGVYRCARCTKAYTVEDGTWRQCTPEFCHDCFEHLNAQHVLVSDPERVH